MMKRMILMLAVVALVAGGFIAWKMHAMKVGMQQMAAGFTPPAVSTVKAEMQDWQLHVEAVGSLRAVNGADLSSEVAGIVDTLSFDSGADVDKGDVLVTLRNQDDIANLNALQATAKLAQVTLDRDMKQLKAEAVSQATVDNDVATLNNAKAKVDAQQAELDKKTIRAPFAGHIGIRQVDIGQYLSPGTAIATLQQLDPIYVDFNLPEQDMPQIKLGQKVTAHIDALPDAAFDGEIAAINAKVDETTRNIQVRGLFKNPDHKLLPGMFAHIAVDAGATARYITLPQTAIVYNTYGNVVYLVEHKSDDDAADKPALSVQQAVVVTGPTRGDQIAILSGLKEGDEVVSSGQVKLRNGMGVTINNDTPAPNDPNPTPHEQ